MLQQKFIVQVTTLPDCDNITRFDGKFLVATYIFINMPINLTDFDKKNYRTDLRCKLSRKSSVYTGTEFKIKPINET